MSAPQQRSACGGFTLVELLVVIALIGLLAALVTPVLQQAIARAHTAKCLSNMRQIGIAVLHYAADHEQRFPRSTHSAFSVGEYPWARSLAPYLGGTEQHWQQLTNSVYRCPADQSGHTHSYGLNVYLEVNPDYDDYDGRPRTWRTLSSVPDPANTILLAENRSSADHIMPNFWSSPSDADYDCAHDRHLGQANYVFVDGHAETRAFSTIYDPANQIDCWHPGE
jgi:prepilin-type N-terminal cleavage/methylation domain-containing protein/prepilin-type processing-associated H-X9-DG protein